MSITSDPAGSRPQDRVVSAIIGGRPWKARHLRNNCLRQHFRVLARKFRGRLTPHPALSRLVGHVYQSSGLLTSVHPKELGIMSALVRMADYSRQWIRDPADWQPDPSHGARRQLYSIASHLFARWQVPEWFGSVWLTDGLGSYQEKDWYCSVGTGASLRQLEGMPPSITRRALHLSFSAPCDFTIHEALRWGQVKALGGSDELLKVVLKSRITRDLENDVVWSRLLEKSVAAKGSGARNFGMIADMLAEVIRMDGPWKAEKLVGLPFRELHRHARRFWTDMFTAGAGVLPGLQACDILDTPTRTRLASLVSTPWARLPLAGEKKKDWQDAPDSFSWTVRELTCVAQLIAEGRAMDHCVDTYGKVCASGVSSVFSMLPSAGALCEKGERGNLTIEVRRSSRRITQIRGKSNRPATPEEIRMVRRWATGAGITL